MRQLMVMVILLFTLPNASAISTFECNDATDKAATYLRLQTANIDSYDNIKNLSYDEIETMISTAQNIINEGERMITSCGLNQEMTESVIDLIIENKEKIKQLTDER